MIETLTVAEALALPTQYETADCLRWLLVPTKGPIPYSFVPGERVFILDANQESRDRLRDGLPMAPIFQINFDLLAVTLV